MAMLGKVRRLYYRQQKSVREIARITSLSRNTIRKWLKAPVTGEPKYRRTPRPSKLTAFHEALQQALSKGQPAAQGGQGSQGGPGPRGGNGGDAGERHPNPEGDVVEGEFHDA